MKSWLVRLCSLAVVLSPTAVLAQTEQVVVKRATELRDAPNDKSRSLGSLAAQTPVTRLGNRQGAWVQVRNAQGATGWLHMFDVTASNAPGQSASTSGGPGLLRGVTGMFGGGTQTTSTSLVGVRGLGAEDIANAQPDLAAVSRAEALRVDAQVARQFASSAGLTARKVDDLPEPERPSGNANQTSAQ